MLLEGQHFSFKYSHDMTVEEWSQMSSAICRVLVAGPPEPPGHRRRVAVRTVLNLYEGAPTRRAKTLERQYRKYLAGAWPRERDLDLLPEPRWSSERVLLHRLAKLSGGASLGWRTIYNIAGELCGRRC